MSPLTRVGFLGLGAMGYPMAINVARAGFPLSVYNRTRTKAEALVDLVGDSVVVCDTPADVAGRADVVITMLADGLAVRDVFTRADGLLSALRSGTVAVDMSTVSPEDVGSLAESVRERGCALVDAPVSGSVAMAESADLTIMVGGDPDDVQRVRPILETMGGEVVHIGPSGSGATMKLVVNTVVYGLNEALSEALVLAERAGIERETAYAVFAKSAIAAPFVHYRREAFERPGEVPVAFRLVLAEKDLRLILELGERVDADLPQALTNLATLSEAIDAGFGDEDVSAVAVHLREKGRAPPRVGSDGGGSAKGGR